MLKIVDIPLRLLIMGGAVFLLYHLVPHGIARIKAEVADKDSGSVEEISKEVLAWNPNHAGSVLNLAETAQTDGEYEKAAEYTLRSLSLDPTNGRSMAMLVSIYNMLDQQQTAQKAAELAPQLWTAHSYVHSTLADYWASQGNAVKVLEYWDLLITRHRSLYKPIFPILLTYANSDEARFLLAPYASEPAPWWNDFFTYMVKEKTSMPVLQHFYALRSESDIPLEANERKAYVRRLQQAKEWQLAYSTWIGGLSDEEFAQIGNIYDGGFETNSHDSGFDWSFRQSKQSKIKLGKTRGTTGKRALNIVFNKRKPARFQHVSQRMLLNPGKSYQVSMKLRLDNLKNPAGLVWRVRCSDVSSRLIGESEPLKDQSKWREMSFDITVPEEGCVSQLLRLESASKYHHELFYDGGVWFDDVSVMPKPESE